MLIATLHCFLVVCNKQICTGTYASVRFHQLLILYQAKAEEKAAERKAAEKEAAEKAAEKKAAEKEAEAKAAAAKAATDEKKLAAPAPAPAPAAPAPAPKAAAPVINKAASGASGVGVVKGGEAGGKVLQKEELSSGTLDFLKQYSN